MLAAALSAAGDTGQSASDTSAASASDSASANASSSDTTKNSSATAAASGAASDSASKPAHPLEEGLGKDAMLIEISTASYYELAARARELGLDDKGGAEEIRKELYNYYGLKSPQAEVLKGKTISIERASQASFSKVEEEEGGIIRASGGVVLSLVEENGDKHLIRADSIVYNRVRSTMTARGSVYYERRSGSTTEIFTGESLSADLNDWSGVFLDGKVRKLGSGSSSSSSGSSTAASGSTSSSSSDRGLVVQADTIVRRTTDVMVLDNGVITACDEEDPHYSLKAGRVWLLGDKEFAVSNAVFSLGNVPILWLPFFYYPGDELVFHPAIGYSSRAGRFVQTTIYWIGRKTASSTSTTSSLLGSQGTSTGPTKLRGLFLHHTSGETPKDVGTLKTIFDAYSGLGGVAGVVGSFDKLGPFSKTSLYAAAAVSRSLFEADSSTGVYTPYVSDANWQSVWNTTNIFGTNLPIRYGFDFSTNLNVAGLTSSIDLPLYSDPYYLQDFTNRSEDTDWFSVFKSTDTNTTTIAVQSQIVPTLTASYSLKTDALAPYLTSIDVTKFTSFMYFLTKSSNQTTLGEDSTLFSSDPRRTFFYPSSYRPFDITLALKGTLLSSTPAASSPDQKKGKQDSSELKDFKLELRDPWGKTDEREEPSKDGTAPKSQGAPADQDLSAGQDASASPQPLASDAKVSGQKPPAGDGQTDSSNASDSGDTLKEPKALDSGQPGKDAAWNGSVTWALNPSGYYEYSYLSENWNQPSDIDYSLLYSLFSYKYTGTISASLGYGDYLSSTASLSYNDQNQIRPYLYGTDPSASSSDASTAASYQLADKEYQMRTLGESTTVTYNPFADSWLWSPSSLAWNLTSTIYNYSYNSSTSAFSETWQGWDPNTITSHTLTGTLAAKPAGLTQSLALIVALPPTLDSYTGKLALTSGCASFGLQGRAYRPSQGADFSYDPLTTTLSVGTDPWPVLADTFVYDAFNSEDASLKPTSNNLSLTWGPFSASLASAQTYTYIPTIASGWIQDPSSSKHFAFTSVSATLAPQFKSPPSTNSSPGIFDWTVSPSISLSQSLVEFTDSTLTLSLSASAKLGDSFTLTFSGSSANTKAWEYYAGLFSSQLSSIGFSADQFQVNPLVDIWNSLSVWDTNTLTNKTNIKLKSLSVTLSQDLHDWTLSFQASATPTLYTDVTPNYYVIDPTFTLMITWKDFSDIQSKIVKSAASSSSSTNTISY